MIGPAYTYKAEIIEVHDGDTVRANIDCGFEVWLKRQELRLNGINAPELKVSGAFNPAGLASRDALVNLLTTAPTTTRTTFGIPTIIFSVPTPLIIQTVQDKAEKYGRWLATLWFTDPSGGSVQLDVNQWLIDQGFAVKYP